MPITMEEKLVVVAGCVFQHRANAGHVVVQNASAKDDRSFEIRGSPSKAA
jgi:hypothetical protein